MEPRDQLALTGEQPSPGPCALTKQHGFSSRFCRSALWGPSGRFTHVSVGRGQDGWRPTGPHGLCCGGWMAVLRVMGLPGIRVSDPAAGRWGCPMTRARLQERERAEAWRRLRPRPSMSRPLCSVDQPRSKGWGVDTVSGCKDPRSRIAKMLVTGEVASGGPFCYPAQPLFGLGEEDPSSPSLVCLCHPLGPGGIA